MKLLRSEVEFIKAMIPEGEKLLNDLAVKELSHQLFRLYFATETYNSKQKQLRKLLRYIWWLAKKVEFADEIGKTEELIIEEDIKITEEVKRKLEKLPVELKEFLRDKEWRDMFSPLMLYRAEKLSHTGIKSIYRTPKNTYYAQIQGTQIYHVEVSENLHDYMNCTAYCDCPYTKMEDYCKHMASVLFYVERNRDAIPNEIEMTAEMVVHFYESQIDENGKLTNAGALIADESPIRQSRIFCTRWNGIDMTNGLGEAIDDVELEGCVIGQLQDAVSFVRNNSRKKWWKESDYREEVPDYPERVVTEAIANAIIHRDYMQMGSEIHIDMYDDRLEIYSPGGMMDGRIVQQLNPLTIPSKRRNPLLADFFSRLGLVERRGSGMKKIINTYKQYERLAECHVPEFSSNATEFHVKLWNLNYVDGIIGEITPDGKPLIEEFVKGNGEVAVKEFVKDSSKFAKEFVKAGRQIYKLISQNPQINAVQMAENMGLSTRQVQKYLKRLQEMGKITREGGRKIGRWKIIDEEYEGFFERI